MTRHLLCYRIGLGAAALLLSAAAAEAQIIPVHQQRSIFVSVDIPRCAEYESMFDQARDFGPFESTVFVSADCALADTVSSSTQASTIGVAQLTAMASSTSEASATEEADISLLANSVYEATFELEQPMHFLLSGVLSAEVNNSHISAGITVTFWDADKGVIVQHVLDGDPDGEVERLADEGLLEPGEYTLRASIFVDAHGGVPPSVATNAFFDLALQVTTVCPADLNGDGIVGPGDLAIILGNWGPVPPGDPLSDLTGDGVVGPADLAIVLGNWGPCE